jgi:TolB protein
MNQFRKYIVLASVTFAISFNTIAQYESSTELKYYLKQADYLLRDGGKWKAINKDYNPKDESGANYFGYEFTKGINANTVHLKITGYFPKKSEWLTFWNGFYTWDYKKQKVVYESVHSEGAIASGESETITEAGMSFVFTVIFPKGKIEKHRDIQKLADNQIQSNSFIQRANKWTPKNSMVWSRLEQPQGNITFMSTRDGNWEIYSMNVKGENLKNLSCNKTTDYMFSYFPKSNQFVYYTNRDGNDEIYIMSPDGKRQTNISKHPSADRVATVSPNGTQILFLSDRDHKDGEIYMMDTTGNNIKRLTTNEYFEDLPVFSPDGKKIIFTRTLRDLNDTSENATSNGEIFMMNTDGTNEAQLTYRPGGDGGAQISPDGSTIAFHGKSSEGNYDIHLMDIDGKNITNITNDPLEDYSPFWSPDGKWIAYTKGDRNNYDVWIINVDTKIKTRLTTHPKRDESPVWQQ